MVKVVVLIVVCLAATLPVYGLDGPTLDEWASVSDETTQVDEWVDVWGIYTYTQSGCQPTGWLRLRLCPGFWDSAHYIAMPPMSERWWGWSVDYCSVDRLWQVRPGTFGTVSWWWRRVEATKWVDGEIIDVHGGWVAYIPSGPLGPMWLYSWVDANPGIGGEWIAPLSYTNKRWDWSDDDYDPCEYDIPLDVIWDPCASAAFDIPFTTLPDVSGQSFSFDLPKPSGGVYSVSLPVVPASGTPLDTARLLGRGFVSMLMGVAFVRKIWDHIADLDDRLPDDDETDSM